MSPSSMLDNPGAGEPKTPSFELFVPAQTVLPPNNARLGVLGGAYNPITRAHLLLARCAKEQFKLHEIIFVLPKTLPNKPVVDTSIEQRLEMMRLGTTDVRYVSLGLCTHGLFLDICAALQKVYLQSPEIFFITGLRALKFSSSPDVTQLSGFSTGHIPILPKLWPTCLPVFNCWFSNGRDS
jgi:hypothetical protein